MACVNQDIYGLCGSLTTQGRSRALSILSLVWKEENADRCPASTLGSGSGETAPGMVPRALLSGGLHGAPLLLRGCREQGAGGRGGCEGGGAPGPRAPIPPAPAPAASRQPHPPHAQPGPGSGSGGRLWSSCEGGRVTARRETSEKGFRGSWGWLLTLDATPPPQL